MGQETHYYNNVIAQLVELRDETKQSNQDSQAAMTEKLNEVIDAIEKIQVTAENIKIEAGTINLSTDEVEALLRTVNTNLGVINDNINEFDTNVKTELDAFVATVKEEFAKLTLNNNTNHDSLTNTITDEFIKLKADNTTKHTTLNKTIIDKVDANITANNTNKDEIIQTIADEINALITNDNTNKTELSTKLQTIITNIGVLDNPAVGSVIETLKNIKTSLDTNSNTDQVNIKAFKDANHADLEAIKTKLDEFKTEVAVETTSIVDNITVLGTDLITNDNTIATALNALITALKDANHTDLTLVKTTLDTINTNIDTELTALKTNNNTNHTALIAKLNTAIAQIGDVTSPVEGSLAKLLRLINNKFTTYGTDNATNLTAIKTTIETASTEIQTLITTKLDLSNTKLESIDKTLHIGNLNGYHADYNIHDLLLNVDNNIGETNNSNGNTLLGRLYVIARTLGDVSGILDNNVPAHTVLSRLEDVITAITNASSTGGETSATTNQLITDIKTLVDAIKTNDGTNTKSIVDAINAIKVTADSIKIDAGTINLSTDEVEGLLRKSNTNTESIKTALYTKVLSSEYSNQTLHDIANGILSRIGRFSDAGNQNMLTTLYRTLNAIGQLADDNDKSARELLKNVNSSLENLYVGLIPEIVDYTIHDLIHMLIAKTNNIGYDVNLALGKITDSPNLTGSINAKLAYITHKQEAILIELGNIKTAITNQTTAITEAMTTQTTAIVNAINNITNNGSKSIVMVDTTSA